MTMIGAVIVEFTHKFGQHLMQQQREDIGQVFSSLDTDADGWLSNVEKLGIKPLLLAHGEL